MMPPPWKPGWVRYQTQENYDPSEITKMTKLNYWVDQAAPDIAFVVFSSNSGPAYRKRYFGEGAEAFLDKSTEFDQLVQTVAKASRYVAC